MKIKIGADELILWLRKNHKAENFDNVMLGKKIADLMKKLEAEFGTSNEQSLWTSPYSEFGLPMTSQQYIIDVERIPEIFRELVSW